MIFFPNDFLVIWICTKGEIEYPTTRGTRSLLLCWLWHDLFSNVFFYVLKIPTKGRKILCERAHKNACGIRFAGGMQELVSWEVQASGQKAIAFHNLSEQQAFTLGISLYRCFGCCCRSMPCYKGKKREKILLLTLPSMYISWRIAKSF